MTFSRRLCPALIILLAGSSLVAQPARPKRTQPVSAAATNRARLSPHEVESLVIQGNRITLIYGRPYTKDPHTGKPREIWGALVPYGKVWRLGADEATTLITQKPIELGGMEIPAGAHTLFLLPADADHVQLIVNSDVGQWGLQYDPAKDLARVPMRRFAIAQALDQLHMDVMRRPDGGGRLVLGWANTGYTVDFQTLPAAPR